MSFTSYHFNQQQPTAPGPVAHQQNHHGRNRRAPRLSVSQNSQRQFRGVKSVKEMNEAVTVNSFRTQFEASRSFDLEDDMEFCPKLLTESDVSCALRTRVSARVDPQACITRTRANNLVPCSSCPLAAPPQTGLLCRVTLPTLRRRSTLNRSRRSRSTPLLRPSCPRLFTTSSRA